MEEENIKTVKYEDLSDDLKEEVRQHLREDEFLVPDHWWEDIVESFKYHDGYKGIDVEEEGLDFDVYYNNMTIEGTIDLDEAPIKQHMTDEYYQWEEKEWIYDFPTTFKDSELENEFYIQRDVIFDEMEAEIFNNEELIVEDGKITFGFSIKPTIEKAIEEYKDEFPDEVKILEEWVNLFNAAELFFQDEIVIEEEQYDTFMSDISTEMERKIENHVEEIIENINGELSDFYDEFKKSLMDKYDWYYTDEYADDRLMDRTFEVETDEDGNESIDDLNGDW